MLTRRRVVAAKIEGTEGTAEAITVADAGIITIDPKFDGDIKMYDRSNVKTATLSKLESIPGQQMGTISFKAEVKGPGATYSALVKPALGTYLRACGFAEAVDITAGAEKVTYIPASSGIPSITIWLYEDGAVHKLKGARGTVSFSGKVGEPIFAEFKFTGVWDGSPALAMVTPTLEASRPPVFLNSTFTIDGYAAIPETFSVDMGNDIQMRSSPGTESGYVSALLNDRKPTGKLDPEMVLPAAYDFMGKWKSGAAGVLVIGPVGTGNYNKFTMGAPKCVYTKVGSGERSGLVTADLDLQLAMNTGDDEFKLEFVK
ncbi:MAG: hypothetical protein A2075_09080 [Geobacteraceae bacterium GWC2_58_44]|nr:MAG: hypothetical protein A2075_09080 [Geobacteraceae bacterium GWC2_58_44]HBG07666.1 hypothetical protein [Geobacter sp.]